MLVRAASDQALGGTLQRGDLVAEPLILGAEFGCGRVVGDAFEPLRDLGGVLVDGLAAALGSCGLAGDGAVLSGEHGGGVEDPGANR